MVIKEMRKGGKGKGKTISFTASSKEERVVQVGKFVFA
jgi:hypothetical protein